MADWTKKPYTGAPPERTIKGFPRPLYPADAAEHGKKPSSRGPDVVAYKRTLCRLQRWGTWDPAKWDKGYWNAFAHGKNGAASAVIDSGVAGFQRQQRIPAGATGWLGEKTFNALCYALVPPGFPHSGEHAMDAVAVDLINEAWDLFHGHDDDDQPASTVRKQALEQAKSQLGYVESGDNDNKYGAWYGVNNEPWCAMFATWCFVKAGPSPSFLRGARYAYVPYVVSDAIHRRNGLSVVLDPIPGDLVCFDWQSNAEFDHMGIFEKWQGPSSFFTIEGNTSVASDSNGGSVMRRSRLTDAQTTVFVRVAEP